MKIFKKEKEARRLVLKHLGEVYDSLEESRKVLNEYVAGNVDAAAKITESTINIESQADMTEREIRNVLMGGAFLPHIRSDVYRLVQAVDSVAGKGEEVANFITNQLPMVPDEFKADLLELFGLSLDCFLELRKALREYFKPKGEIEDLHEHAANVGDLETATDVKESAISKRIFGSSIDHSHKTHLVQLVAKIGEIADLSEDAADELEFAALKSIV